ncbi:ribose-phosphate pyrophosphokinase [Tahibacter sp.]|uniref:ribose-phosphate pyrophosphokinase n=1 Tax=Tahibacter sp. TaxID=2056211 RepID=UPI0028C422FE|nr:ribose-phosphate pyrophosphokinase [Tahibacter sp.]
MKPMQLYAMPGNEAMCMALASCLEAQTAGLAVHRFPDGESRVTLEKPASGAPVAIVASLHDPDAKVLPLLFAADTLRELGASRIGLIAPYLAYMRQDTRFHPGESISSRPFAAVLSRHFDWLVTVDPHLHRYRSLDAIYTLRSGVTHAAPALAEWIATHVERPVLLGPDEESRQWVDDVAARIGAPSAVLAKQRHGDRDVTIRLPTLSAWKSHTPVLLDDIIASGGTLAMASRCLRDAGMPAPYCVAVHGLFAAGAIELLRDAGVAEIKATNTVPSPCGGIDVAALLARTIETMHDSVALA